MNRYETEISKHNMDQIETKNMTPKEIIDFLKKGALFRSFSDILKKAYPGNDLEEKLKKSLITISGVEISQKEQEALEKDISNWLCGRHTPQNREQLFKICFALELDEETSNKVLASVSETGIHYRNPKELIYAYALRTGKSYSDAVQLNSKLIPVYQPIMESAASAYNEKWKKKRKEYLKTRKREYKKYKDKLNKELCPEPSFIGYEDFTSSESLTLSVKNNFYSITNDNELENFFLKYSANLGTIHESAYEEFYRLLDILRIDDRIYFSNGVLSVKDISQKLRMDIPYSKETKDFDDIQNAIKKGWPGKSELNHIINRTSDVSRKTLLLLFLITEEFFSLSDDEIYYGMDETPEQALASIIDSLNEELEKFGMNPLDPGSPFDCLFLYALAAQRGSEAFGTKFKEALNELFRPKKENDHLSES